MARLEVCPECGYSLKTLPVRHRCPECGFEYDEFTRVWKADSPRKIYWKALGGMAGLGISLHMLRPVLTVMRGGALSWPERILLVGGAAFSLLTLTYILLYHTANKRSRYVAITPLGLRYRDMGESESMAWEHIVIEPRTLRRGAYVRRNGELKDALPKAILDDHDMYHLLDELRKALEREGYRDALDRGG